MASACITVNCPELRGELMSQARRLSANPPCATHFGVQPLAA